MTPEQLQRRLDLAASYRLANRFGFSDLVWNHISARVPGSTNRFLMLRFGLRYDEVKASNLVEIDSERPGKPRDGDGIGDEGINYTGFVIHRHVYKTRPEVQCLFHSHSEAGLVAAALEGPLELLSLDSLMFHDDLAYHDFEGMSLEDDESQRIAADLGSCNAMILRNHGLLTAGETVAAAFMRMYYLDRTCRVHVAALSTGAALRRVSDKNRALAARQFKESSSPGVHEWPALLRLLARDEPDYKD